MVDFSKDLQRALGWWELRHKHSLPRLMDYQEFESTEKSMNETLTTVRSDIPAEWLYELNSILLYPAFHTLEISDQIHALFHELWHYAFKHRGRVSEAQMRGKETQVEERAVKDFFEFKKFAESHYGFSLPPKFHMDPRVRPSLYKQWYKECHLC